MFRSLALSTGTLWIDRFPFSSAIVVISMCVCMDMWAASVYFSLAYEFLCAGYSQESPLSRLIVWTEFYFADFCLNEELEKHLNGLREIGGTSISGSSSMGSPVTCHSRESLLQNELSTICFSIFFIDII